RIVVDIGLFPPEADKRANKPIQNISDNVKTAPSIIEWAVFWVRIYKVN
ncbi:MAG: hypothetical protein UY10_C0036G0008, partial [Microgenomates group bacterium GW2011_GWA2_47_8]